MSRSRRVGGDRSSEYKRGCSVAASVEATLILLYVNNIGFALNISNILH